MSLRTISTNSFCYLSWRISWLIEMATSNSLVSINSIDDTSKTR